MNRRTYVQSAKWLALATVFAVAGCASDGKPAASAGEVIDDSMITAKVKTAFVADKDVSALDIGVETNKGVVQLRGKGSSQEAQRAEELARNIAGVKSVQNGIQVN